VSGRIPVPSLSDRLLSTLTVFAVAFTRPAFTRPTFAHLQVLISGTLLATGRRTVTAALRAVGLDHERHFTTYHRVLNRAVWSPLPLSRILLGRLIAVLLPPDAPVVLLIDGTLERMEP
jgi:DDE superfamily endonuclease